MLKNQINKKNQINQVFWEKSFDLNKKKSFDLNQLGLNQLNPDFGPFWLTLGPKWIPLQPKDGLNDGLINDLNYLNSPSCYIIMINEIDCCQSYWLIDEWVELRILEAPNILLYKSPQVKEEARISIAALEQSSQSSFDVLFMTHESFPRTFDYIFQ